MSSINQVSHNALGQAVLDDHGRAMLALRSASTVEAALTASEMKLDELVGHITDSPMIKILLEDSDCTAASLQAELQSLNLDASVAEPLANHIMDRAAYPGHRSRLESSLSTTKPDVLRAHLPNHGVPVERHFPTPTQAPSPAAEVPPPAPPAAPQPEPVVAATASTTTEITPPAEAPAAAAPADAQAQLVAQQAAAPEELKQAAAIDANLAARHSTTKQIMDDATKTAKDALKPQSLAEALKLHPGGGGVTRELQQAMHIIDEAALKKAKGDNPLTALYTLGNNAYDKPQQFSRNRDYVKARGELIELEFRKAGIVNETLLKALKEHPVITAKGTFPVIATPGALARLGAAANGGLQKARTIGTTAREWFSGNKRTTLQTSAPHEGMGEQFGKLPASIGTRIRAFDRSLRGDVGAPNEEGFLEDAVSKDELKKLRQEYDDANRLGFTESGRPLNFRSLDLMTPAQKEAYHLSTLSPLGRRLHALRRQGKVVAALGEPSPINDIHWPVADEYLMPKTFEEYVAEYTKENGRTRAIDGPRSARTKITAAADSVGKDMDIDVVANTAEKAEVAAVETAKTVVTTTEKTPGILSRIGAKVKALLGGVAGASNPYQSPLADEQTVTPADSPRAARPSQDSQNRLSERLKQRAAEGPSGAAPKPDEAAATHPKKQTILDQHKAAMEAERAAAAIPTTGEVLSPHNEPHEHAHGVHSPEQAVLWAPENTTEHPLVSSPKATKGIGANVTSAPEGFAAASNPAAALHTMGEYRAVLPKTTAAQIDAIGEKFMPQFPRTNEAGFTESAAAVERVLTRGSNFPKPTIPWENKQGPYSPDNMELTHAGDTRYALDGQIPVAQSPSAPHSATDTSAVITRTEAELDALIAAERARKAALNGFRESRPNTSIAMPAAELPAGPTATSVPGVYFREPTMNHTPHTPSDKAAHMAAAADAAAAPAAIDRAWEGIHDLGLGSLSYHPTAATPSSAHPLEPLGAAEQINFTPTTVEPIPNAQPAPPLEVYGPTEPINFGQHGTTTSATPVTAAEPSISHTTSTASAAEAEAKSWIKRIVETTKANPKKSIAAGVAAAAGLGYVALHDARKDAPTTEQSLQ